MPVVPMRQGTVEGTVERQPPPNPTFALIAATQMHSEGRLLASDQTPGRTKPSDSQLKSPEAPTS